MLKREPKYFCIKDMSYEDSIIYIAGNFYNSSNFYDDEPNCDLIGIYGDSDSGCEFKLNKDDNIYTQLFSDYFITIKQLRKLKLQKINETT